MNKAELRAVCLARRRAMPPAERDILNERIRGHLRPLVAASRCRLAYLAYRGEPDLRPLFDLAGCWAIPRVEGDLLRWHRYDPSQIRRGSLGPLEPDPACEPIDPAGADLALVPVVACDRRGFRLGYGGGFYDRFLARQPLTAVGIAFAEFVFEALPVDPWDQPLAAVVTEAGLFWCRS